MSFLFRVLNSHLCQCALNLIKQIPVLSSYLQQLRRLLVVGTLMTAFSIIGQQEDGSFSSSKPLQEAVQGCPLMSAIEVDMPRLSAEQEELVREALNLNGSHRFPVCAFRARSDSNRNKNWIEQYIPMEVDNIEPGDEDQIGWSLESVESRVPTEKELASYEHRGGSLYPYLELHELVDFSKLEVLERTNDTLILVTQPTTAFLEQNDAEMLREHVTTTLVINVQNRRIDFVTTKLNGEIKPNPFMRVYEFDQSLDYEYVPEIGEVVLTEMKMRADVKFVVVRRQFHLSAELYDFSCPLALQPEICADPVSAVSE